MEIRDPRNRAMIDCIVNGGTVSFEQIDASKRGIPVEHRFVVDNDPAHPEMHPDDAFLLIQQALGVIHINLTTETVTLVNRDMHYMYPLR